MLQNLKIMTITGTTLQFAKGSFLISVNTIPYTIVRPVLKVASFHYFSTVESDRISMKTAGIVQQWITKNEDGSDHTHNRSLGAYNSSIEHFYGSE